MAFQNAYVAALAFIVREYHAAAEDRAAVPPAVPPQAHVSFAIAPMLCSQQVGLSGFGDKYPWQLSGGPPSAPRCVVRLSTIRACCCSMSRLARSIILAVRNSG